MNYGAPLRVEFLIPGAATLASGFWFVSLVAGFLGTDIVSSLMRATGRLGNGSVQAIVVLFVLIGAAYALGVVIVMATFFWPTTRLIANLRALRLAALRGVENAAGASGRHALTEHLKRLFQEDLVRRRGPSVWRRVWWTHPSRWWHQFFTAPSVSPYDLQLAVTLARAQLSQAAQAEYEYRRAIRQVCIGMVPSALIATVAAQMAIWTAEGLAPPSRALLAICGAVVGMGVASGLLAAVQYQESVAQWLLLDTAFLHYWKLCQEEAEFCPRCRQEEAAPTPGRRWRWFGGGGRDTT